MIASVWTGKIHKGALGFYLWEALLLGKRVQSIILTALRHYCFFFFFLPFLVFTLPRVNIIEFYLVEKTRRRFPTPLRNWEKNGVWTLDD